VIKTIKIGDLVYQNIEAKIIDEDGNEAWNIPDDLEKLRTCAIDTFNWQMGQEVKKASGGDYTKLSAVNSKAITLIIKALDGAADKSNFTDTEKQSWDAMLNLANSGYSDSNLLLSSLNAVIENIARFMEKIEKSIRATTFEELIELLEG
jgi:hypothetical protein